MRINYLITAYNEPLLLKRTVSNLQHKDAFFYIHVDGSVNIEPFQKLIVGVDNVSFLQEEDRVISKWGDISTCDAILRLMRVCLSDIAVPLKL